MLARAAAAWRWVVLFGGGREPGGFGFGPRALGGELLDAGRVQAVGA